MQPCRESAVVVDACEHHHPWCLSGGTVQPGWRAEGWYKSGVCRRTGEHYGHYRHTYYPPAVKLPHALPKLHNDTATLTFDMS